MSRIRVCVFSLCETIILGKLLILWYGKHPRTDTVSWRTYRAPVEKICCPFPEVIHSHLEIKIISFVSVLSKKKNDSIITIVKNKNFFEVLKTILRLNIGGMSERDNLGLFLRLKQKKRQSWLGNTQPKRWKIWDLNYSKASGIRISLRNWSNLASLSDINTLQCCKRGLT